MIRDILSIEGLDVAAIVAAILTFIAAISAMFFNAWISYRKEGVKKKHDESESLAAIYQTNKSIMPQLKHRVYDLHVKYLTLKDCDYISKTNKKCVNVCERNKLRMLVCGKMQISNLLYLISFRNERLEPEEKEILGKEHADRKKTDYNNTYVDEFIGSAEQFIATMNDIGFPRLSKKHSHVLSNLHFDIYLLIQVKDLKNASLKYCIRSCNLEKVKKFLSSY